MLLGLPSHLAPQSSARAVARACHFMAMVLIAGAALLLTIEEVSTPAFVLWPALIALVPMALLLVLVERVRSTLSTVAYLIIGAGAVYVYALVVLQQITFVDSSDAFTVSLPKLALVMVGGSGLNARRGPLWATVGLAAGELATQIATLQSGSSPRFDVTTFLGYVLIVSTMGGSLIARDRAKRLQPNLHRAARDDQISAVRYEVEQKASALVHDTVLSHLAALAIAPAGRLDPALRSAMERDLEALIGREWSEEAGSGDSAAVEGTWATSPLAEAIAQGEGLGLEIAVTGDLAAVTRLDALRSRELALTVRQCLANVLKHSGTNRAELVVFSTDSGFTAMVIDNGVGFVESETPADRLGLRNSIRARIERVGGTVQIWSAPGSGTSVMIGLPFATSQPEVADTMSDEAGSPVILRSDRRA